MNVNERMPIELYSFHKLQQRAEYHVVGALTFSYTLVDYKAPQSLVNALLDPTIELQVNESAYNKDSCVENLSPCLSFVVCFGQNVCSPFPD